MYFPVFLGKNSHDTFNVCNLICKTVSNRALFKILNDVSTAFHGKPGVPHVQSSLHFRGM